MERERDLADELLAATESDAEPAPRAARRFALAGGPGGVKRVDPAEVDVSGGDEHRISDEAGRRLEELTATDYQVRLEERPAVREKRERHRRKET